MFLRKTFYRSILSPQNNPLLESLFMVLYKYSNAFLCGKKLKKNQGHGSNSTGSATLEKIIYKLVKEFECNLR